MKIDDIKSLIAKYGGCATLSHVLNKEQGVNVHMCPKCHGYGKVKYTVREANWGYWEAEYGYKDCDLCNGIGYTEREYKPRMVQDGWV